MFIVLIKDLELKISIFSSNRVFLKFYEDSDVETNILTNSYHFL
jgi:hypothetical protein